MAEHPKSVGQSGKKSSWASRVDRLNNPKHIDVVDSGEDESGDPFATKGGSSMLAFLEFQSFSKSGRSKMYCSLKVFQDKSPTEVCHGRSLQNPISTQCGT
ncbi:hypothetical protein V6N11_011959 [Hibiscus sabdariffa]